MTVASELSRVAYATDGVSDTFVVPFRFLHASHLRVVEARGGVEALLVRGTHYSVAGVNQPSGGVVIMTTAPAAGGQIVIVRMVPVTQETSYPKNDPFPERAHEQALDKLTMIAQQQAEGLGRAIKVPVSWSLTGDAFVDSLFQARDDAVTSATAAGDWASAAAASEASATASADAAQASASSAAAADISANAAASGALNTLEIIASLTADIPGYPLLFVTDNGFGTVYQDGGFDMGELTFAVPFFNEAVPNKASLSIGTDSFDFGGLA